MSRLATWFLMLLVVASGPAEALADASTDADAESPEVVVPEVAEPEENGAPEESSGDTSSADTTDHGEHEHGEHEHGAGHSDGESHEAEGPNPLDFDLDLAWFTLIVFIALAALLRVIAWDPICKALDAREAGITGEIAAAAAKHDEAKALLAQHEAKIAAATDEVKGMLDEARRDAEVTKAQIIEEARQAAEAEKTRAVRDVEQARDSAIKNLAEQSANMAIDLASKVVKQEITGDRQNEIVREAIGRMASAKPSSN